QRSAAGTCGRGRDKGSPGRSSRKQRMGRKQKDGVGDRTNDPGRNSLRLLPSGPDRVGEGPVRRRPPTALYQGAISPGQVSGKTAMPRDASAATRRDTGKSAALAVGHGMPMPPTEIFQSSPLKVAPLFS